MLEDIMMQKALIQCPKCERNGKRQILAEVDQNGHLVVMRFHHGTTRIISNEFIVICGECGEEVFFRKNHEYSNIGNGRIYRQLSVSYSRVSRKYSNQNSPGTFTLI